MMDKADILIPRGSVISGRMLDEFGDPVTDAMVSAMRSVWSNGRRRLQPAGRMAMTNDLGQFRIYGLPAGDYYVSAALRDTAAMEMSMMGGATAGRFGAALRLRPHLFPRHGERQRGAEDHRCLRPGRAQHGFRAPARTSRQDHRHGHQLGRQAGSGSMVNAVPRNGDNRDGHDDRQSSRTEPRRHLHARGVPPGDYILQSRTMQIMTSGGGDMMTFSARVDEPGAPQSESVRWPSR